MYEDEDCVIYSSDDTRLEEHPVITQANGTLRHEVILMNDPDTGMVVKLERYSAGVPAIIHTHECAKGMYVLRGTLRTEHGNFGPGSFIWWKEGASMFHGATQDEDVDVVFITNKPLVTHNTDKQV